MPAPHFGEKPPERGSVGATSATPIQQLFEPDGEDIGGQTVLVNMEEFRDHLSPKLKLREMTGGVA